MESGVPEINQRTHWDSTYAKRADFFGVEPSDFGVRAAATLEQHGLRRILELGCGQGRDTFLFLQRGFEVTALDYAETGLRQMQEKAKALGVDRLLTLQPCDMRAGLPFADQSFDGCFSHMFFTMQLTEKELERIFREVLRILKPGGLNIYSVRNTHDPHFQKGKHIAEDCGRIQWGSWSTSSLRRRWNGSLRAMSYSGSRNSTTRLLHSPRSFMRSR